MEMTQYQRDFVRMLDSMLEEHKGETTCLGIGAKECEECLLANYCENDICFNAEKIIEIVTQWAKEHPFVTNEDKYKEDWGVEPRNEKGVLCCPKYMGLLKDLSKCHPISGECEKCKEEFWNSEYREPKKEGDINE